MMLIRKYMAEDAWAVAALISKTYSRFNAHEGTPEAVRQYVDSYNPVDKSIEEIRQRFTRTPCCFVASANPGIVGVVRGIENRIVNLFVDEAYHRQKIATRLVQRFEEVSHQAGSTEIVLRASLYAIPFYQALGYKKTTGIRNFHGLSVQPMKKNL